MPSNTVLISGPAVGAAQILIWSYSCVFLPLMPTGIRASAFSFVGALKVRSYIPPLHVGRPLGFAPEAALEDLGLPL